jgi:hypothetical protein
MQVKLGGGDALIDCRHVPELRDDSIELQLGADMYMEDSIFSDRHYSPDLRDRLISCVEKLASLDGFEAGFSIYLGQDQNDQHYRTWFGQCVVEGELSLTRFVNHHWLSRHAIFAGPAHLAKYGREVLLNCPAWRISSPRDGVLCVFLDNLYPSGRLRRAEGVSHIREALPYLRKRLRREDRERRQCQHPEQVQADPWLATYRFVLLYNPASMEDHLQAAAEDLFTQAGFRSADAGPIALPMASGASGATVEVRVVMSPEGGEARLRCRNLSIAGRTYLELQLGVAHRLPDNLFAPAHYSASARDRLVACMDGLTALEGFEAGFSCHLDEDETEDDYQIRFKECFTENGFQVPRFVTDLGSLPHAVFIGPQDVATYEREPLLDCDAWKTSSPREDVVCLYLDSLFPCGAPTETEDVSYVKQALMHLGVVLVA